MSNTISSKTGILLINLGGPDSLEAVKPFLVNLFSDQDVFEYPFGFFTRKLFGNLAARLRLKSALANYEEIGGKSPLREISEQQAAALELQLKENGCDMPVAVGMAFWHPFFSEGLRALRQRGCEHVIVFPLYPQFSLTSTGSGFNAIRRLLKEREFSGLRITEIPHWHTHPGYITALASRIMEQIGGEGELAKRHFLFSAHSIPMKFVKRGDPYPAQIEQTMRAVVDELGLRDNYSLSFQSKVGPVKWLEPFTGAEIRRLAQTGVTRLFVIPVSFVSDHVETLGEIDIQFRAEAHACGIKDFECMRGLNCQPQFIGALTDVVMQAMRVPIDHE